MFTLNGPEADVDRISCPLTLGFADPYATDENKMTGVYAAGDIARAPHSFSWAVANGVTAGTTLHRALVFE